MKKLLKLMLLLFWLALIFFFSSQNSVQSSKLSNGLLSIIANTLNHYFNVDQNFILNNFSYLFRKLAHFSEYFLLLIISYENYVEYKKDRTFLVILPCILYAFLDEFHQLFVDGRAGQLSDVGIDSLGIILGYCFWHLLLKK